MKFPMLIRHGRQGPVLARIYKSAGYEAGYRVAYRSEGKRLWKTFPAYADAKTFADDQVKELAGNIAKGIGARLPANKENEARTAFERLDRLFQDTGRRVSLTDTVSEYCRATEKLVKLEGMPTLHEVVKDFLKNNAGIKTVLLKAAVEEFIAEEQLRTKPKPRKQRAELSEKYAYNRAIQLRRFAGTLQNAVVKDLANEELTAFFTSKPVCDFSPKSRNHHRMAVKQFLGWCAKNKYLSVERLGDEELTKDGLVNAKEFPPETLEDGDIEFYVASEFRKLLLNANGPMQAMVALSGQGGLRTAELLRISWEEIWRRHGQIEITAVKSKTRKHRLIEVCPALASWLEPFRGAKGKLFDGTESVFQKSFSDLCEKAGVDRKVNGLRHSFCTFLFAKTQNEHLASAQAGNSPDVFRTHYKGLATKEEGEEWFTISAKQADNVIFVNTATAKG